MKTNITTLQSPLDIDQFRDGESYSVPGLNFVQTNLFFEIAFADGVVVKRPSQRGRDDFEKYVRNEQKDWDDVRGVEDPERFANLSSLCSRFPDIGRVAGASSLDDAHYLLVHKLQHERLKGTDLLFVPTTRFVMLDSGPAIAQEKVTGTSLWQMYDHIEGVLQPRWKPLLPVLSQRLGGLLGSDLRDHLNWNIKNLIYDDSHQRLYYVDCTPSVLFARSANEHNIRGVREVFVGTMGRKIAVVIFLSLCAVAAYFAFQKFKGQN